MLPNQNLSNTIFILTCVLCDVKNHGVSKANMRVLGYYESLELAVQGINEWVNMSEPEDAEEMDNEPILPSTVGFVMEEKELNKFVGVDSVSTRLYARDGSFLDEEMVSYADETPYRGRSKLTKKNGTHRLPLL